MTDVSELPADVLYIIFKIVALLDPPIRLFEPIRPIINDTGRVEHTSHNPYDEVSTYKHSLGWIQLSHVCRHWRTVGLNVAPLWASIVIAFHKPNIANELLSRARDCPLHLEIHYQISQPMFLWILEHFDRAHTIHCDGYPQYISGSEAETLAAISKSHLRLLRHLRIRACHLSPTTLMPHILQLNAPELLRADLQNCFPSPSSL